jgi:hypothetical protein
LAVAACGLLSGHQMFGPSAYPWRFQSAKANVETLTHTDESRFSIIVCSSTLPSLGAKMLVIGVK